MSNVLQLFDPHHTTVQPMRCRVTRWQPIFRGALLGKVDVLLADIMELFDCAVMAGANGKPAWVSTPGKVVIGRDGKVVTGANGKPVYEHSVAWRDRDTGNRWSASVLAALHHQFGPNVLDGGAS